MAELAENLDEAANSPQTARPRPGEAGAGRPFQKGQSGNPTGRPKGIASAAREVLRRAVDEGEDPALALVRFWASVMSDPSAKMEHRLAAARELADRGYGKAPQFAPIEDDDPLGLTMERENEIAEDFERGLDELAERRRQREETERAALEARPAEG